MKVRVATAADLPLLKELRDAFYADSPPPEWMDESWEAHEPEIVTVVDEGGALLAERDGEAVGFALAWRDGRGPVRLGDMYVRPDARRGGA
ncbi:MAG: GNAT family N-acetyltransferase, partial [Gaiellaceae bacterium]